MKVTSNSAPRNTISKKLSRLFSPKSLSQRKSRWLRLFPRYFSAFRFDISSGSKRPTTWLQRLFLHNKTNPPSRKLPSSLQSFLNLEPLEERAMLATFVVDTANDVVSPTDGVTSLREAIATANATPGEDDITFDVSLSGTPIVLNLGELEITEELSITGSGAGQTIIDADLSSRIFNISATTGDFLLQGMTLTKGLASTEDGGAIRSTSSGLLTIADSVVTGSSTQEDRASGGGIYAAGNLTLTSSTVSGNYTTGYRAYGGGLYAGGDIFLSDSTISGNDTSGNRAEGGGIAASGEVTLTDSTVSGNSTEGSSAGGGGIYTFNVVTLTNSTVSGNSTQGSNSEGGGISSGNDIHLNNSTLSGNSTLGANASGGGIYTNGYVYLTSSTLSNNFTEGDGSVGGGIYAESDAVLTSSTISGNSTSGINSHGGGIYSHGSVILSSSIVAGNAATGMGSTGPDIDASMVPATYSLLGDNAGTSLTEAQTPDVNNNLIGSAAGDGIIDPLLSPLADNGGPTETHALVLGSPAINTGNNPLSLNFDQRGTGFDRTVGAGTDMGALELQSLELVVTTATDELDLIYDANDLSLREAITIANNMAGIDTITFSPSLDGTPITLSILGTDEDLSATGDLDINEGVNITGRGENNTIIDGGRIDRVFEIITGDVTMTDLTIQSGDTTGSGGGVYVKSGTSLSLSQTTISDNRAALGAGIKNDGAIISISGTTISANFASSRGGGIHNAGIIDTISQSTITGNNTGTSGGGIYNQNVIGDIDSSTISNNDSGLFAGGLWNDNSATIDLISNSTISQNRSSNDAGGIANTGLIDIISNSTISRNESLLNRAGGLFNSGTINQIASSTVADNLAGSNGGGIWNTGTVTSLESTIIAGNTASSNPDLWVSSGAISSAANNLIEESAGHTITNGISGNIVGVSAQLLPLTDNGGPTLTHSLLPGSPAIDAGSNPNSWVNDQRGTGFSRTIGAGTDIGAFEQSSVTLIDLIVTTADDELDSFFDPNDLSLREAIAIANANPGADTITFSPTLDGVAIAISIAGTREDIIYTGDFDIHDDLSITGRGETNTILDGSDLDRLFEIHRGTVNISELTIQNGFTSSSGGGLYVSPNATLSLSQSAISGNDSTSTGGGITNRGTTNFYDTTITGNQATFGGGGIYNLGTINTISGSTVDGNSADRGGGIRNNNSITLIEESSFSGNTATYGGGILNNFSSTISSITSSTISGNEAVELGGGIYNDGALSDISFSNVDGNQARQGGGIYNLSSLTISSSTVSGNEATEYGAGIYNTLGTLSISQSTIADNYTPQYGGGIYNSGNLSITQSTISGNTANSGGGGIDNGGFISTISNSTISGNTGDNGGGIDNFSDGIIDNLINSTISGNTAVNGGGIYLSGSSSINNLVSTIVANNNATTGPDILNDSVIVEATNNLVEDPAGHSLTDGIDFNIVGFDPVLGALADNGGPTLTHALLSGSPAIDAGSNPFGLSTGQRGTGFPRVFGPETDIGAFELQNEAPTSISIDESSIGENSTTDTTVGTISVTDANPNDSHTITLADNAGGRFQLMGTLLQVANGSLLNFEDQTSHQILVSATDSGGLSITQALTISVNDLNDPPTDILLLSTDVDENSPGNTVVGVLSVIDEDMADLHSLSLVSDPSGFFEVAGNEIQVADGASLDFETQSSHQITVSATDSAGSTVTQTLTISVNDLNESPTDILLLSANVDENSPGNTVVGVLSVVDEDMADSHSLSLVSDPSGFFEVAGNEIQVKDGASLDFETQSSYQVIVSAVDSAGSTVTQTLTITVNDLNEPPTAILVDSSDIDENSPPGTLIGTFSATDEDTADSHTFSLASDPSGLFLVEGNTLKLSDAFLPEFEVQASYDIIIAAVDASGLTVTQDFTITVNDLNEAPTNILLTGNTVFEDAANGTIVGTASAIDPDNSGALQDWSISSGNNDGIFAISSTSGQIIIADNTNLDFESADSHTLTLTVTDGISSSVPHAVTINVLDVNEAPVLAPIGSHTVDEESPLTFFAIATDNDLQASSLSYSLSGDIPNGASIDPDTGLFSWTPTEDQGPEVYSFDIVVLDNGTPPLSDSETITVTVNEVNSPPSDILMDPVAFSVNETAENGTFIGSFTAVDQDPFERHTFFLLDDAGGRFSLIDNQLFVADGSLLNFSDSTSHQITVWVRDSAGNLLNKTITVEVTEAPPEISLDSFSVVENADTDTFIGNLSFKQLVQPTFFLTGNADGRFKLVGKRLLVDDGSKLDFETNTSHEITILAVEINGNAFEQILTIHVTDVLDPPVFSNQVFGVNVNSIQGASIGFVKLRDSRFTPLQFEILQGNAAGIFSIDAQTGELRVENPASLDKLNIPQYELVISATDDNDPPQRAEVIATINVFDDENPPTEIDVLPVFVGGDDFISMRVIRGLGETRDIRDAIKKARSEKGGFFDTTPSFVNHYDPETGRGIGLFRDESLPFPSNTSRDDDNFIVIYRGAFNIPEGQGGQWTFGVHSSDGFALNILGQQFTSVSGLGFIDPEHPSAIAQLDPTSTLGTRGTVELSPGNYDFEFITYENTEKAYWELYSAPGAFQDDSETDTWRLVGSDEGLQLVRNQDARLNSLPGRVGDDQPTIVYNKDTGDVYLEAPENTRFTTARILITDDAEGNPPPEKLRFRVGEANWRNGNDVLLTDTPLEQSFVAIDRGVRFTVGNAFFIGNILPSANRFDDLTLLRHIRSEFVLEEAAIAFVPEAALEEISFEEAGELEEILGDLFTPGNLPILCFLDNASPSCIDVFPVIQSQDASEPDGPEVIASQDVTVDFFVYTNLPTSTDRVNISVRVKHENEVIFDLTNPDLEPDPVNPNFGFNVGDSISLFGTLDQGEIWHYSLGIPAEFDPQRLVYEVESSIVPNVGPPLPPETTIFTNKFAHYEGVGASVEIENISDLPDANSAPGPTVPVDDPVTRQYSVLNTGSASLENVSVVVEDGTEIISTSLIDTGDGNSTLDQGETWIYEATGTALVGLRDYAARIEADVVLENVETVMVSDENVSHYCGSQVSVDGILTLDVDPTLILENAGEEAAFITVSREANGSICEPLEVSLISDDVSEATVPSLVTIPAGETSVLVPITAVDDPVLDGLQEVLISASATGFIPVDTTIMVDDEGGDKPREAGDSNDDGEFDLEDIVQILIARKFGETSGVTWAEGDWDGNGTFDVLDVVAALMTGNFNQGSYATLADDVFEELGE